MLDDSACILVGSRLRYEVMTAMRVLHAREQTHESGAGIDNDDVCHNAVVVDNEPATVLHMGEQRMQRHSLSCPKPEHGLKTCAAVGSVPVPSRLQAAQEECGSVGTRT